MSDRIWNARQREAIDVRGKSVVVSAAAGSGKTSVLTERVLALIEDGHDIENMLIVTFTNLAAGEMKERIYRRLQGASDGVPRLAVQAEKCAFADISTIHAFCGRVIRDNFEHAGVLPTFAIADTAQIGQIRQRAMDAAVAETLEQRPVFLAKFAPRGDLGGVKNIVGAIYSRVISQREPQQWLNRAAENFMSDDFTKVLLDEYGDMVQKAADKAAMYIAARSDIWRMRGFDAEADMSECARIEMLRKIRATKTGDIALPTIEAINASGVKNAPNRESNTLTGKANKCFDALRDYSHDFTSKVSAELKATADDGRTFIDATCAFMKRYARAKRAKNVIDHDDTIHFALRALSVPDIAARYRSRYTHVFVDEYQDINDAQNAIINSIARDGNDFLVGDVKQCIYTFRESNPDLLMRRCRELSGNGLIEMNTNYRSEPRIIDFINGVMHHMMTEDAGGVEYTGGHRLGVGRQGDGCARIVMANAEDTDSLTAEGAAIGQYIRTLVDDGYSYKDIAVLRPEINTSGKQIARILEQMDIPVISGAQDKDTAFGEVAVFINLLTLIDRPVSDIALLSVMRYPHFGFSETELAHIRIAQDKDERGRDKSFYHAVHTFKEDSDLGRKTAAFLAEIERYRRLADCLPVPDFLMRLRHEASFREYAMTSSGASRSDSAIAAFIANASAVDAATLGEVLGIALSAGFGGAAPASPGEMDAVYLTTIHKSKGLEFPAVILSGMHKKIYTRDTGGSVLVGRGLGLALDMMDETMNTRRPTFHKTVVARQILREKISETVRLLYVGMTRAIKHLAIVGAGDGIKDKWLQDMGAEWQHDATTYFDLVMPAAQLACRQNGQDISNLVRIVQDEPMPANEKVKSQRLSELFAQAEKAAPANMFVGYAYESDLGVPSKLSVSALKRRGETQTFSPVQIPSEQSDISAAERGTLMHKVLQKIGPEQRSEDEVRACIRGMVQRGTIDDDAHVDPKAIAHYLSSDIAARARRADKCFYEAPFCLGVSANEAGVAQSDENIIVQGVIDMCFLEDDSWVVVDYKTDRIEPKLAQDAAQKYTVQLGLYAKALRGITGKDVKEKIIYFLEIDRAVSLP